MSDEHNPATALCIIRAERQASGQPVFTVSALRDVGSTSPPRVARTVSIEDVLRLVEAFAKEL